MKKPIALLLSTLFLVGCDPSALADDRDCYFLDDEAGSVYLIVDENGHPRPNLVITGPKDEDRVTVYGIVEDGSFIYPDGHRLYFNETEAWGSEGSLIEDIRADKVSCPGF